MSDIFSLVYWSSECDHFTTEQLESLASLAQDHNQSKDITGILYYKSGYFFQYLEGKKSDVMGLMNNIEIDPRHEVICTIFLKRKVKRLFKNWSLKLLLDQNLKSTNSINLVEEMAFQSILKDNQNLTKFIENFLKNLSVELQVDE